MPETASEEEGGPWGKHGFPHDCDVPYDVAVHTSNPAVELLHALYFHLT